MIPFVHPAFIYILGALCVPFLNGRVRKGFMLFVALATMVVVFSVRAPVVSWRFFYLDFPITLFFADRMSMLMGYIFSFMGLLCILYSIRVEKRDHQIFAMIYVGSSLGMVFAGDLFSFLVFWEIMAITGAGLVFAKGDERALGAGFRYLIMHLLGGAVLMAGILVHYASTSDITMGPVAPGVAAAAVLFGIGLNCAFLPIHTWLPDAYPSADFTGTIFLAIFTTKGAVYALARTSGGPSMFVAYMGALIALYGALYALMQNNARKVLSYSVMSQVGYMVAAVGVGSAVGINGAFYHIFNHIVYKTLLFMCVGAVIYSTGVEELSDMGGLAKSMPVTTAAVLAGALAVSGVPFFSGFVSKALIFESAHNLHTLYLLLELAAVGTFLYYSKFVYYGFLRKREKPLDASDPPLHMRIPIIILALMSFAIGVYPGFVAGFLPFVVEMHFYSVGHVLGAFLLFGTTGLIFWDRRGHFVPVKRVIIDFDYFYRKFAVGFLWFCKIPSVRFDSMINQGYEGAGERMMEIAIPATKIDTMIDRGYENTSEKMVEIVAPASKFNEVVDKGYVKTGETFLSAESTPAKGIYKMFEEGYMKGVVDLVNALGSEASKIDIDQLYIKREGELVEILDPTGIIFDKNIDILFVKKKGKFEKVYTPPEEEKFLLFGKYAANIPSLDEKEPLMRSRDVFFEFTNHAAAFDLFVIDGFINLQGKLVWIISRSSDIFDLKVVDGVVNWIGQVLHSWGGSLRKPETGIIHDYASSIILGVIFIGVIVLLA